MRIGKITGILMVSASIFFDIVEAILALFAVGLIINRVIVLFKWCIFMLWFWIKGVHFLGNPKRLGTAALTFGAGLIPVIGALPEFTVGIITIIKDSRKEDALKRQGVSYPRK